MLVFNRPTAAVLRWTSDLAHVVISLALVAATLIIAVFFFHEVYAAIKLHSLIKGFLHALGILLLLWTMVELINTEIRYLKGEGIKAAVQVQKSTLEGQLLRVKNLDKQWQRKATLYNQQLINADVFDLISYELEYARVRLKSIKASLSQAKAQLHQAQNALNKTQVYSPIDGVITSLDIKVGETAISGTTNIAGSSLMTIANPDSIYIEVNVDEADIASINVNQDTEVVTVAYPNHPLLGVVDTIASSAKVEKDRKGLSFSVKIRLTDTANILLRPGMSCRAEIFTQTKKQVTAVPIQAILIESDISNKTKHFLYLSQEGVAQKVEVTTGISDDEYQEITSGIDVNDIVIVGPDKVLRNLNQGDAIQINKQG